MCHCRLKSDPSACHLFNETASHKTVATDVSLDLRWMVPVTSKIFPLQSISKNRPRSWN